MYKNHYIAVFLGCLVVKDNEMYSRAPKFVIYEQKEFNKEKKEIDEIVLRPKHGAPPSCPNEYVKNTNFWKEASDPSSQAPL